MLSRLLHVINLFFPEQEIYIRRFSLGHSIILFVILTIIFSFAGALIPTNGFIGFDWFSFFGVDRVPAFYPPWTIFFIRYLTYPLLVGITCSAFSMATIKRAVSPLSAIYSFFCLPFVWTIFLGQLEGLVVLGILGLPWFLPLLLIKPQISIFSIGARKKYIFFFLLIIVISTLIWGNWFSPMFSANSFHAEGRFENNIGLGWWGLPLFLLTVWFSRGDMDMLMASGAFVTPYVIFYNLLPLTPAVARLKPRAAIIAIVLSYLTFSSNWLGPKGWWLGWGFVPWVWINLAAQRYPNKKFSIYLRRITG